MDAPSSSPESLSTFNVEDLATWPHALREDHGLAERRVAVDITRVLVRRIIPPRDWLPAFSNGLIEALMTMLSDKHICGFTLEEVKQEEVEYRETVLLPYLIDILVILQAALYVIRTIAHPTGRREIEQVAPEDAHCEDCVLVESVAFSIKEPMQEFLSRLWVTKDTLLIPGVDFITPHDIEYEGSEGRWASWSLGRALLCCYLQMDFIIKAVEDVAVWAAWYRLFQEYAVVLSQLYRYSKNKNPVARNASGWLMDALQHISRPSDGPLGPHMSFTNMIKHAWNDRSEIEALFDCVLNDFKRGDDWLDECDYLFVRLVDFVRKMRFVERIRLETPRDRATLWFSMAAFRRQVCSAIIKVSPEEKLDGDTWDAKVECCYINIILADYYGLVYEKPAVPEVWLHSMVHIYAMGMGCATVPGRPEGTIENHEDWTKAVETLSRWLHWYNDHPSKRSKQSHRGEPPVSMRRFTQKAWEAGREDLRSRDFATHPKLQRIWIAWNRIGDALRLGERRIAPDDTGEDDFQILKRCSWKECPCSVFKPNHRLRVCDGCSMVAYCTVRCQIGDWENHRSKCAREHKPKGKEDHSRGRPV